MVSSDDLHNIVIQNDKRGTVSKITTQTFSPKIGTQWVPSRYPLLPKEVVRRNISTKLRGEVLVRKRFMSLEMTFPVLDYSVEHMSNETTDTLMY